MRASIIIPTHNRPYKLEQLLCCLRKQDAPSPDFEVIVVDDNSKPPVELEKADQGPETLLVRLDDAERSAARNKGAARARGEILIFMDDDMKVGRDFVSTHLSAHERYPDALAVGSIRLPEQSLSTPFGRFRQKLEDGGLPEASGPTAIKNFCTAANMSIARERFFEIGGFDDSIVSSEDQDLALRHSERGHPIVFLPEATAIHCDDSLDIRSYCRRAEWGSRNMIPFCVRYPEREDNIERARVNGPLRFGREPLSVSLRKVAKSLIATKPTVASLFTVCSFIERTAPNGRVLGRVYRLLLGAHIFRGYRKGLKQSSTRVSQLAAVPIGDRSSANSLSPDRGPLTTDH